MKDINFLNFNICKECLNKPNLFKVEVFQNFKKNKDVILACQCKYCIYKINELIFELATNNNSTEMLEVSLVDYWNKLNEKPAAEFFINTINNMIDR